MPEGEVKERSSFLDEKITALDPTSFGTERVPIVDLSEEQIRTPRQALEHMGRQTAKGLRFPLDALAVAGGTLAGGPGAGIALGITTDLTIQNILKNAGIPPDPTLAESMGLTFDYPFQQQLYSAGEALAINELGGLIGQGVIRVGKPTFELVKGKLVKTFFPKSSSKIFDAMPNAPTRYSNIIDSERIGTFEGLVAPIAADRKDKLATAFIRRENASTIGKFLDFPEGEVIDSFSIANLYKGQVDRAYKELSDASDIAFDIVTKIGSKAKNIGIEHVYKGKGAKRRIVKSIPVNGPTYQTETVGWASRYLQSVDDNYMKDLGSGKKETQLLNRATTEQKPLVAEALQIMERGVVKDSKGKFITDADGNFILRPVSIEASLKSKKIAGRIGFAGANPQNRVSDDTKRAYISINRALDKDIETSIVKWKDSPKKAWLSYRDGNRLVATRIKAHEDVPIINSIRQADKASEKQFEKVFEDESTLEQALRVTKNPVGKGSRKELQAGLLNRTFEKALKAGGRIKYSGEALRTEWYSPTTQRLARKLFTKEGELERVNNFIEFSIRSQTRESQAGKVAVGVRLVSYGAYIGGSAATGAMFTQGVTPGLASGALIGGAFLTMNQFVRHILLNDKAARAFSVLTHGPQTTEAQRAASKIIAGSLRGVKVLFQSPKGGLAGGTFKEDETVELDPDSVNLAEFQRIQ